MKEINKMTKINQLKDVAKRMRELGKNTDKEVVHGNADDLLFETIKILSNNSNKKETNKIIKTFNKLDMWYA